MVLYSLKESCIRGWYLAKNVSLNTKISKNKIIIKRLVSTAFPVNLKSSLSFGNLRCEQIGNRLNFYNKHGTNMHDIRCWTCLSMFDWIINSSFTTVDNITNLIIMRKCYSDIWKKYVSLRKNKNDLEIYQINGTYVYHLIFDSNVRTICLIVLELKTIKKFDWC